MKLPLLSRRPGLTAKQMQEAPSGAVYVWPSSRSYAVSLARTLGRDDLEIVPLSWLDGHGWMGRNITGLVIDHAAVQRLKIHHWEVVDKIKAQVQWPQEVHSRNH